MPTLGGLVVFPRHLAAPALSLNLSATDGRAVTAEERPILRP
jgi:hypothetical protein